MHLLNLPHILPTIAFDTVEIELIPSRRSGLISPRKGSQRMKVQPVHNQCNAIRSPYDQGGKGEGQHGDLMGVLSGRVVSKEGNVGLGMHPANAAESIWICGILWSMDYG